ncbi:hypothetical protein [Nostoc sp.]|uniref:hypothetical protein n=1 Tax=Nostoc sp. TaxID=1180 RepID=UPI002FF95CE4
MNKYKYQIGGSLKVDAPSYVERQIVVLGLGMVTFEYKKQCSVTSQQLLHYP